MSYYITWWKDGMEMPARLGPMTFEDRGDAERVAAGLNKKISRYITPRRRGLSITLLTEVLRCYRGGDAVESDRIGRILERAFHDPTALLGYTREDRSDMLDCIKRHQKAASLMEGQ